MASHIEQEDGVLVLTDDNFEEATKGKTILIYFYQWGDSWQYRAAQIVQALADCQSPWLVGKVHCGRESKLDRKFAILDYPTFLFFNGESGKYVAALHYPLNCEEALKWMQKKAGPAAIELTSVSQAINFTTNDEDEEVSVVGYFASSESQMAKTFQEVAWQIEGFPFAIVHEKTIAEALKFTDEGVAVFKMFDAYPVVFEKELTVGNLRNFIVEHCAPLVQEFPSRDIPLFKCCGKSKFCVIFMERANAEYVNTLEAARIVAKEFRDTMLVLMLDPIAFDEEDDGEDDQGVSFAFSLAKIKIDKEVFPALRLIDRKKEGIGKYKPEKVDLSENGLRRFLTGVLLGKIKGYYASAPLPEDWNEKPAKVLVQSNFDAVVFDKSKDVFVDFYAPWCGPCQWVAPIIEQLAEKFIGNEGVLIAKIDAHANELENATIKYYPTFKLYKRETNEVIEYNGDWSLESFSKFIESGGEFLSTPEESDEEESESDSESDPENEGKIVKCAYCSGN